MAFEIERLKVNGTYGHTFIAILNCLWRSFFSRKIFKSSLFVNSDSLFIIIDQWWFIARSSHFVETPIRIRTPLAIITNERVNHRFNTRHTRIFTCKTSLKKRNKRKKSKKWRTHIVIIYIGMVNKWSINKES